MSFSVVLCSRKFLWFLAPGTQRGNKLVVYSFFFSFCQLICSQRSLNISPPDHVLCISIISGPIVFLSPFHPLNEANGAVLRIVGEFLVCPGVSCRAVSVDSRQEVGSWITSHPVQPPPCYSQLQTFSRANSSE